ncbi:MAG TPA: hypothetical protein VFJ16_06475 [Longimicrobium sp.]|nr:hypothetical protein [Longimicrobium sp.]
MLSAECWVLGAGCWVLGAGCVRVLVRGRAGKRSGGTAPLPLA